MTIKTLKMVRFGPYIKETVVDFEQFTGKVFLVSGDTGAGKTTIFDAVCYAPEEFSFLNKCYYNICIIPLQVPKKECIISQKSNCIFISTAMKMDHSAKRAVTFP